MTDKQKRKSGGFFLVATEYPRHAAWDTTKPYRAQTACVAVIHCMTFITKRSQEHTDYLRTEKPCFGNGESVFFV